MKMRFLSAGLALAVTVVCAGAGFAQQGNVVAPGVTHYHFAITSGPLNYNVVKADIADPRVRIEVESGKDRLFAGEKVLDSVKREARQENQKIVAAVNADFWAGSPRAYTPVGMLVSDGMIFRMPGKRSVFALSSSEEPYIGKATLKVSITAGGKVYNVDTINDSPGTKDVTLFTPPYGSSVPPAEGKRYVIKLVEPVFLPNRAARARITKISSETSTPLSADMLVLHVPKAKAINYSIPDTTAELLAVMPEVRGVVTSVCGGGPSLVRDGKVQVDEEGTGKSFSTTRHPRTAIGYSKDKKSVFLVTVDGRQSKVSIGSSLDDLAASMIQLGCWRAMNLDGGGSTTMVVDGKVVNKPSDAGGPRTVASSVLVISE